MDEKGLQIEEEGIDIRKWLFLIWDHWYLFVIFICVSLALAEVYNRITPSEYELYAKVLIKEDVNPLDKANIINVSLNNDPYRLENEIGILHSSKLTTRVLKNLDFYVEYYQDYGPNSIELYHSTPFLVSFDPFHNQLEGLEFDVEVLNDSMLIIIAEGDQVAVYNYSKQKEVNTLADFNFTDTIRFGDTIQNEYFKYSISQTQNNYEGLTENGYCFVFRSLSNLVGRYSNIKIDIPKGSSIITLSTKHTNPEKASEYLNALVSVYLERGIERKTRVAQLTIDFIDGQLSTIVDSLQLSEQKLEDFRSKNQLVNIDHQAQQVYERQTVLENQMADLSMQRRYLEYLKGNLESDAVDPDDILPPSTMGISDAVLNNLVLELIEQYKEFRDIKLNTRKTNPYITSFEIKIEATKAELGETVDNLLGANLVSVAEIESQIASVSSRLERLPKNQRELLKFQRSFNLNDELYTYLLTRRSEMQIEKASTLPVNEVLEEAKPSNAILVKPNRKINYFLALFLGGIIPIALIYFKSFLNQRVESVDDIKHVSDYPVVGTILNNENIGIPAVVTDPGSVVAESFRILRANMKFVLAEIETPVIMVTSAMKGEGKSYNSINLAAVYASYGSRVCLVDLDLRRSRLSEYLSIKPVIGMSNCLIGKETLETIKWEEENWKFDLYPAGPIPPNPSELVASPKLAELITELKQKYDIVLLDTPPIGMVSDALLMNEHTDVTLLMVRHNITYVNLLSTLLKDMERNKVRRINIIYNDVPTGKKGYYRYGYRYSYYEKDKKRFKLFGKS